MITFQRTHQIMRCNLSARAILLLCLSVIATPACGEDQPAELQRIKHQITGLFMPDREQDLRELFKTKLPQFKLMSVDYVNAEAVLEYAPAKVWQNEKPEKFAELLNNHLRNNSRGTFGAKPLRTTPLETLKLIEIPVVGLDCKGCSYAAYQMIFKLPGVERATVSFKTGKVAALIDPSQTEQQKLEEALKKGGVELPAPAK
ncbi:MAG: copper chaperone CopZ [Pirellulaceae bacterium]|jgi:copper chaperone CopZ